MNSIPEEEASTISRGPIGGVGLSARVKVVCRVLVSAEQPTYSVAKELDRYFVGYLLFKYIKHTVNVKNCIRTQYNKLADGLNCAKLIFEFHLDFTAVFALQLVQK